MVQRFHNQDMKRFKFLIAIAGLLIVACGPAQEEKIVSSAKTNKQAKVFTKLNASETGVDFVNKIPIEIEASQFVYHYAVNGGGVAIADLNNDGLQDIYFTCNPGSNKLYLNKGEMRFEDVTAAAGVASNDGGWNTGVTCADINADGWMDIYVSRSGDRSIEQRANLLYINQQDGTFKEQAKEYGLNDMGCGTQAAFFDHDLDGDLDAYIMNHPIDWDRRGINKATEADIQDRGINSDKFYVNEGGKFTDASVEKGLIADGIGFGLGLSVGYLNEDRYPDIFIGNDYVGRDLLYYYDPETASYQETGPQKMKHMSNSSMGTDISDLDNDGDQDIIVMEMNAEDNFRQKVLMPSMDINKFWATFNSGQHFQYMYNMLHANVGNGFFSEVGQMAGISNTDWSWSVLAADYDLDGLKDLYITNGYPRYINGKDIYFLKAFDQAGNEVKVTPDEERVHMYKVTPLPNYAYKNLGDLEFSKTSAAWGVSDRSISMGAAYADLDNDGDLDLVVNNYNDTAFVYQNDATDQGLGNGLNISLIGEQGNISAIGASINLTTDKGTYGSDIFPTRGFQSSVPPTAHFGFAKDEKLKDLTVTWPNGMVQTVSDLSQDVNQIIKFDATIAQRSNRPKKPAPALNQSTTGRLSPIYSHSENDYDDFKEEVLIPHRFSQFGPALASGDLNNDGLIDVVVGGAAGQTSAVYYQNANGTYSGKIIEAIAKDAGHEDIAIAIFDIDGDKDNDIYIGSGGNEHKAGSLFYQDRLYLNENGNFIRRPDLIPDLRIATKTLAPNDFDGDGDIDLFVGAGHIPRRYGADAPCTLLRNDGGRLNDVTAQIFPDAQSTGMINKAIWANVDGQDGNELILAGDWMPISMFKWNGNSFENRTKELGLSDLKGWWSSVAARDMDGDGDMDLLGGNLGLNYKYKASPSEPFKLFAMDFDESGTWDIALGYFNQGTCYPVRGKQCSSEQMPTLKEKFPTYEKFGNASIYDVYGEEKLENALERNATHFASMYFENNGDGKFTAKPLPRLAQVSSVNAFVFHDVNGDGNEDVLIAGNLFQSEIETPRNDASNGLVLLNLGSGNFEPLEGNESGFFTPYDVKDLKAIKTNDRVDIFVANNNGPVELYSTKK